MRVSVTKPERRENNRLTGEDRRALAEGATRYTATEGILPLREAVAADANRYVQGLAPVQANEVVVSNGSKQSLYNACVCCFGPGDEVLIPTPTWPSHTELVRLAGGIPILCPSDASAGFAINIELLRRKITPRTRLLLLCSPSNPTGAVIDETTAQALVLLLREHPEIIVMTDDLYRRLVYAPGRFVSLLTWRARRACRIAKWRCRWRR